MNTMDRESLILKNPSLEFAESKGRLLLVIRLDVMSLEAIRQSTAEVKILKSFLTASGFAQFPDGQVEKLTKCSFCLWDEIVFASRAVYRGFFLQRYHKKTF